MTSRRSIWGRLRHRLISRRPTAGFLREPSLAHLLLYLRPLRSQLARVVAISLTATVVTLITPLALRSAIDSLQPTVQMAQLVRWVVLLIGLAATAAVLHAVARVSTADISRQFEYRLRQDLFDTLQALPARTLRRYGVGDLISRVMSDVSTVRAILGPATTYPWTTTVTTVVALIAMISLDVRLTCIALTPVALIYVAVRLFGWRIGEHVRRVQEHLSAINTTVHENVTAVRMLKAFRQEENEIKRFGSVNAEYLRVRTDLGRLQSAYQPTTNFLLGVSLLIVFAVGGHDVAAGRRTMGDLVAFSRYLMMLGWPMIAFGWFTGNVRTGLSAWTRIEAVLNEDRGSVNPPGIGTIRSASQLHGGIEFRDVTIALEGRPLLHSISAITPAGTTTAIMGVTGSGKSTLVSLLVRLIDPPPGTVFLDGVDILMIPREVVREAVAIVPQEPFIFAASVAENITLGCRAPVAEDSVASFARIAAIDDAFSSVPDGFATIVGERGGTLSGGQRQRIAIARAIAANPRILVLDDACSSVDAGTEQVITDRLLSERGERTHVFVTHRVATAMSADQILVLDEGRLVERGSHAELLAQRGIYARLHQQQFEEQQFEAALAV